MVRDAIYRGALGVWLITIAACQSKPEPRAKGATQAAVSGSASASAARVTATATPSSTVAPPVPSSPGVSASAMLRAMGNTQHSLADCENAELKACLAPLLKPKLTSKDIRGLEEADCFESAGAALKQAGDCLPLSAGVEARTGKALLFSFTCSDVCPDQGGVLLHYEDIDEKACCALGGEPYHHWPDSYYACAPVVNTASWGSLLASPDGKWRQIHGSRCPGRPLTIYSEWPCEPRPELRRGAGVQHGPLPKPVVYAKDAQLFSDSACFPHFDAAGAERTLSSFDAAARECVTGDRAGTATVQISFAVGSYLWQRVRSPLDMVVSTYLLAPSRLNNKQGRCIEEVYRRATVPRFRERSVEILYELPLDDGTGSPVSSKSRFTLKEIKDL